MLLTAHSDFSGYTVGEKAHRLQQLTQGGYSVPEFVVLSSEYLQNMHLHDVMNDVVRAVPAELYAVRSAALQEDTATGSQAGQFMTKLAVKPQALVQAVREVVQDAQKNMSTAGTEFSLIIQKFIEPQWAGVLFTRNPVQGREMVLEYVKGRGVVVVNGESANTRFLFTDADAQDEKKLPFLAELYTQGKRIEFDCDFPQDIEWAYAADTLYILQTRPITSLTQADFLQSQSLDKVLPKGPFFYEQTSITESFSRPTPLALSLLHFLYQADGAIDTVYSQLGLTYNPASQFVTVGNQLYVDRQAETQSLFPALGHIKYKSIRPRLESLSGIWTTLRNTLKLTTVSTQIENIDYHHLVDVLKTPPPKDLSFTQALQNFSQEYISIFTINLCAQLALTRFEGMVGSSKLANELIELAQPSLQIPLNKSAVKTKLVGNSLSFDDTSQFTAQDFNQTHLVSEKKNMSLKEKALLLQAVRVNDWIVLRELGRWLTVKLMSDIKQSVHTSAAAQGIVDASLVPFLTQEELGGVTPSTATLKVRKRTYEAALAHTFPSQLASYKLSETASATVVLSPGYATGVLCQLQDLPKSNTSKPILLVAELSPQLTKYFSQVAGIVCTKGGLLSHLAIMAREAGLPVILDTQATLFLQKEIVIDSNAQTPILLVNKP